MKRKDKETRRRPTEPGRIQDHLTLTQKRSLPRDYSQAHARARPFRDHTYKDITHKDRIEKKNQPERSSRRAAISSRSSEPIACTPGGKHSRQNNAKVKGTELVNDGLHRLDARNQAGRQAATTSPGDVRPVDDAPLDERGSTSEFALQRLRRPHRHSKSRALATSSTGAMPRGSAIARRHSKYPRRASSKSSSLKGKSSR